MLYPKALESNLGTSDFPFFPIQASSLKGELTCTIFPAAFGPRVAGRPGEQSGTDGVSFSSHFITATGLRQKNTKTHIRCCHYLQFLYKRLLSNAPRSYSLLLIQLVFNFPSGITDAEISADTFFKQSLIPERCKPTPQTYLPQKNKQTNKQQTPGSEFPQVNIHRTTELQFCNSKKWWRFETNQANRNTLLLPLFLNEQGWAEAGGHGLPVDHVLERQSAWV